MQRIEPVIRALMATHQLPGLVLGVEQDGERRIVAFGSANAASGEPVTPETRFQVGSISKVFTATAVMALIERGALDLDRPVRAALPAFRVGDPEATERITLRHLLSHTGGFDGNIYIDVGPGDDALERDVALLAGTRQRADPGTLWHYANSGFSVAGRLLELHHGVVFEAALRRALLAPLGLERTCFSADPEIPRPFAKGHQQEGDTPRVTEPWAMPRQAGPAGGVVAGADDLLTFARFHLDGRGAGDGLAGMEALAAMRVLHVRADPGRAWGLGWWLREADRVRIVGHNGLTFGFTAQLTLVPERGAALVLLTNRDEATRALLEIEQVLFAELLGLGWWEPVDEPLSADALAAHADIYHDGDARFAVEVDGERLRVARDDGPAFSLTAVRGGGFRAEGAEFDGKYGDILPGSDGRPRRLRFIGILADREEGPAAERAGSDA